MTCSNSEQYFIKSNLYRPFKTQSANICHLLNVLKALNFNDPEARDMQLPCSIWVDLYVQFLSILTQQVSEK